MPPIVDVTQYKTQNNKIDVCASSDTLKTLKNEVLDSKNDETEPVEFAWLSGMAISIHGAFCGYYIGNHGSIMILSLLLTR